MESEGGRHGECRGETERNERRRERERREAGTGRNINTEIKRW